MDRATRVESRDFFFFFFTLVTGPRRSLSLKLSDTRVYEPQTRAWNPVTPKPACRVACVGVASPRMQRFTPSYCGGCSKVDIKLPGKGNSNSHGARPVHLIITMIQWIRTCRMSIQNSLSRVKSLESALGESLLEHSPGVLLWGIGFRIFGFRLSVLE